MSKLGNKIKEVREDRGWTQKDLARSSGYSQPTIADIESGSITTPRKWKRLADSLEIGHEEFLRLMKISAAEANLRRKSRSIRDDDSNQDSNARIGLSVSKLADTKLPVYGRASGGVDGQYHFNGEVIGWALCPPSLEGVPGAYAVYVDGESMVPRYRPGETVWAHPTRPVRQGNDVVVQLLPESEGGDPIGFIKEFVSITATRLILQQFNPDKKIQFDRERIISVHPIVFAER